MTGAALVATAPAPMMTLQDGGRVGWQRFGVSRSGAMDIEALELANAMVGNPPGTAALEFANAAGSFRLDAASARVAITGGHFAATVDGRPIPCFTTVTLLRGQILQVGSARDAVWGTIAVAGGFDLPLQLGSHATHARSAIGGFDGGAIAPGAVLPLAQDWVRAGPERRVASLPDRRGPVRVVLGPQQDWFTDKAMREFTSAEYRTTYQMDRLGYRLDGPALTHSGDYNIISDGLVAGCIQVPGSCAPIVLMRDAQPPGGYPKIATIISADLGRLAQKRPGTRFGFKPVTVAEAQAIRRDYLDGVQVRHASLVDWVPPLG